MPTNHKKMFAEKLSNGVHHLGEMLLIPTYDALDALDAYFPDQDREHYGGAGIHNSHTADHDQQQSSLSRRIGNGMHNVGEMMSIPTYEAIDACAQVPHADPRVQEKSTKSGNIQKMCRTLGAMLSVPIYEVAESCGKGPRRGH
uniref:Uncharacterized protein n=1 Tax=Cryptomonas curvata TaxID=233186 RepID=A0A7S0MS57_9CRYP|mmetsp:Transcript_51889/g.108413  ORF Transcript_51889/g.108413 Transcript_51889/m.108413 type:complete len:144 (+) Transcript_51889:119-550(+)